MSILSVLFLTFMYVLTSAPMGILAFIIYKKIDDRDVIKSRKQAFFVILVTLMIFPHPIALIDGQTHLFIAHASSAIISTVTASWEYYAPWTMKYTASAILATGCVLWLISLKIFNEKVGGYNLED